jgi:hypothetical protein
MNILEVVSFKINKTIDIGYKKNSECIIIEKDFCARKYKPRVFEKKK